MSQISETSSLGLTTPRCSQETKSLPTRFKTALKKPKDNNNSCSLRRQKMLWSSELCPMRSLKLSLSQKPNLIQRMKAQAVMTSLKLAYLFLSIARKVPMPLNYTLPWWTHPNPQVMLTKIRAPKSTFLLFSGEKQCSMIQELKTKCTKLSLKLKTKNPDNSGSCHLSSKTNCKKVIKTNRKFPLNETKSPKQEFHRSQKTTLLT